MHIGSTDNRRNKQIYSKKNGREAPISSRALESLEEERYNQ